MYNRYSILSPRLKKEISGNKTKSKTYLAYQGFLEPRLFNNIQTKHLAS